MKARLFLLAVVLFAGFISCKPSDEKLQKEAAAVLSTVSSAISSEVKNGQLILSGEVESDALKAGAEEVVKAIKGIKAVVNNIKVKLPEPIINPDDTLKGIISTAITAGGDAFKDVIVEVEDGVVNLTGKIKKADLQKVMQIVNEAKPKKVNNQLTITK
ncbi:MAG: BON domain-containing protein [Tannerella sp.]|jgi:osmotically-inducible protein OsmY|nr:BON domain-containing protein [Tannerella sp.]